MGGQDIVALGLAALALLYLLRRFFPRASFDKRRRVPDVKVGSLVRRKP